MIASCGTTVNGVSVATLDCIFPVIATIISWALMLAGAVAVIFIIIAGIKFITSNADAKRIDSARKTFIFAVLGIVLCLLSFLVINMIGYVTGVACISSSMPLQFSSCGNNSPCSTANPYGYCTPPLSCFNGQCTYTRN